MLPIYYIGLVQTIFAALLINKKPKKSIADIVLIIWLCVMGVEMAYSLLNITLITRLPDLIIIPLTYGPFLYLYTQQLLSVKPIFKPKFLLHFIPFAILAIVAVLWKGPINITAVAWFDQGTNTYLSMANYLVFMFSICWYWLYVLRLINRHQEYLNQQLSFENTKIRLDWVKRISWWILGAFTLSGITYLAFIVLNIYPFNPMVIFHIGLLLFVFSISFFGIHQTNIKLIKERQALAKKDQKALSKTEIEALGLRMEKFMLDKKPYLLGELTLEELAKDMHENIQDISYYLNHYLHKNFFTYINEYRVNEAKARIANRNNKNLTLLAIGYDSGFNSKSSFNSLFKQYTGYTPSEYQRKTLNA